MSSTPPSPARLWPPEEAQLPRLFERARLQRGRALLANIDAVSTDAHGAVATVRGTGGQLYELNVQGVSDAQGRPHYSALCSCGTRRFCEHAAAVMLKLQTEADAPARAALLHQWATALRRKAGREELKALPRLPEADAARLMDLLMGEALPPAPAAPATAPAPAPAPADESSAGERARFQPRLTLRTLGRGDGLLGMAPDRARKLGPRGDAVTVAQVDWTYVGADGLAWQTPVPRSLLNSRPALTQALGGGRTLARDLGAEAEARWTLRCCNGAAPPRRWVWTSSGR